MVLLKEFPNEFRSYWITSNETAVEMPWMHKAAEKIQKELSNQMPKKLPSKSNCRCAEKKPYKISERFFKGRNIWRNIRKKCQRYFRRNFDRNCRGTFMRFFLKKMPNRLPNELKNYFVINSGISFRRNFRKKFKQITDQIIKEIVWRTSKIIIE